MFSGIIKNIAILIIFKYLFLKKKYSLFLVLKFNYFNFLDLIIGDSLSFCGLCITLLYKSLIFFEFNLSYKTILNIFNIKYCKLFNIEKSIKLYNNINGSLVLGHINNILILKYIYIYKFFFKFCFLLPKFLKRHIIYKCSISLDGVNFTINEIEYFFNNINFCINIIYFTYKFTVLKKKKIFDFFNVEFDLTIYYILNFLYF